MKPRSSTCRNCVHILAPVIACLAIGCGGGDVAPDPSDVVLAAVPCEAWRPSDADWSSLPAPRPAILGAPSASPSGNYLYSVGTWFEAGKARRQILRSHDLGETWCVLPTPDQVALITPSRASGTVLYALTCPQGGGAPHLQRTIDGGATWATPVGGLPDGFADCSGASSLLQTSVTDPNAVWLNGIAGTGPYGSSLYVSHDGGESWTVPYPPAWTSAYPLSYAFADGLLVDPIAATRVLAWGTVETFDSDTGRLVQEPERWFSTQDLGSTWREIEAPPTLAGSRPPVVLVDVGSSLYVQTETGLLRSSDWAETWSARTLPDPLARPTTLSSGRAGQLYAWNVYAGLYVGADATVWRTDDGGASWNPLSVPLDPAIDPVLSLHGGDVVVGVGLFGMSTSKDGGRTWTAGPLVPAPGNLAQSPVDWRRIWADDHVPPAGQTERGTSSPSLQSTDGGLTWTVVGDASGRVLMDGASADVAYQGVYFGSGGPARTEDGGRTWVPFPGPDAGGIAAAATCPPPGSCLYVLASLTTESDDACSLARSDDHGRTWTQAQPVPAQLCWGAPTIAASPDEPAHLVAACVDSLCETSDGGQSWTSHAVGTDPKRMFDSILFTRGGVVLAATTGTTYPGDPERSVVARSTDGGSTWTEVMPEGGVLAASAAHPETVFLISRRSNGADAVYRSDDSGATWNLASPPAETTDNLGFKIMALADTPEGGFIASTVYGLVQFK
jgi:photosystem II stability/assembly factor-like uncharacterized protein